MTPWLARSSLCGRSVLLQLVCAHVPQESGSCAGSVRGSHSNIGCNYLCWMQCSGQNICRPKCGFLRAQTWRFQFGGWVAVGADHTHAITYSVMPNCGLGSTTAERMISTRVEHLHPTAAADTVGWQHLRSKSYPHRCNPLCGRQHSLRLRVERLPPSVLLIGSIL